MIGVERSGSRSLVERGTGKLDVRQQGDGPGEMIDARVDFIEGHFGPPELRVKFPPLQRAAIVTDRHQLFPQFPGVSAAQQRMLVGGPPGDLFEKFPHPLMAGNGRCRPGLLRVITASGQQQDHGNDRRRRDQATRQTVAS